MYLSQSTAITIAIGPFTRVSDGALLSSLDPENDISVKIVKGATMSDLTITNSGGDNDMVGLGAFGMYSLELTATNTNTIGLFMVLGETSDAYLVKQEYLIIDQAAYDEVTNGGIANRVWTSIDGPLITTFPIPIASSTSTTLVLDISAETYPDDYFNGTAVTVGKSDLSDKQFGIVTDYDGTTSTATIDREWITNPDSSYNASFWPSSVGVTDANLVSVNGQATTADVIEELFITDADTVKNNFADALLKRDWTQVTGEATRSVLNALRFLRNRRSIVAGVLNTTTEDDTTVAWSANLTTDANAEPITDIDPT